MGTKPNPSKYTMPTLIEGRNVAKSLSCFEAFSHESVGEVSCKVTFITTGAILPREDLERINRSDWAIAYVTNAEDRQLCVTLEKPIEDQKQYNPIYEDL